MEKIDFSKIVKFSAIFVLIAAMVLCMFACGGNIEQPVADGTTDSAESQTAGDTEAATTAEATENASEEDAKYTITVTVIDDKGKSTEFEIKTNAEDLADALLEAELVEGEDGEYGLYIKSVNGLRADYDLDGAYWALSKNGEMLMTGASDTPIADGEKYELTYTKG